MEKDHIIELQIEDMLDDGRAFGRHEGCAVFVSGGAVPGDTVSARIVKAKKSSAEAELLEIIKASPDRIEAACPFFADCGGCTMQELSYEAQLELKKRQVKAKLERLGGLEDSNVNDCIGAETLEYYRNKAVFAVGPHGEVGFKKAKSHFVMDIDDCILQSDAAMVCADALRVFLSEHPEVQKGKAPLVGMTVKTAFGSGEVMVVLETGSPSDRNRQKRGNNRGSGKSASGDRFAIPDIETLVGMLDDAVYSTDFSLESIAVINGNKCRIIAGKPTITEEITRADGRSIRFEISPQSFYQVNPEQMLKLYDKAAEYACLQGGETVLDLYCGAGTIGIWLLDELRSRDEEAFDKTRVIGIESVKSAVIDANRNSVINNMINTRYFAGRAEEELPGMMGLAKLYKWNEVNERVEREPEIKIDKVDVAVLDPPRAGCDEALLAAVAAAQPDRIVYVSCDPGTLARDIRFLTGKGYEFIEATPVDQFPWTSHIEAVALLSQQMPDDVIEVNIDLDEDDATSAETKATYQKITDWVWEKYGLKVSRLYISQIKRKCGLEVGDHYNNSRKENQRVPQCPPEKEEAIIAALRFFRMI